MGLDEFFLASGLDPRGKIRRELSELFDRELPSLKPSLFYIVGHKAYHLYKDYNERLMRSHFLVGLFGPLVGGAHLIRVLPPRGADVYIAVDSINTGKELETVLKALPAYKLRAKKIFCFVANTDGINRLREQNLITPSQLASVHELPPDNYEKFYRESLQVYYQSIIEPMDTDHPYRSYFISEIVKGKLVEIIGHCVSESIGKKPADSDIIQAPENMFAFSFDFLDMDGEIPKRIKDMFAPVELGLESISIRVRALLNEKTNFSLVVCCQPNIDMKTLFKDRKRICDKLVPICYIKRVQFFRGKGGIAQKVRRPLTDDVLCPLCMSCNVSVVLLSELQRCLFRMQETEKYEIATEETFLPFL